MSIELKVCISVLLVSAVFALITKWTFFVIIMFSSLNSLVGAVFELPISHCIAIFAASAVLLTAVATFTSICLAIKRGISRLIRRRRERKLAKEG